MEQVYIPIGQGGIGIINKNTPKEILGIYTDKIQDCINIIIIDKKTEHIWLAHVDGVSNIEVVFQEFERARKDKLAVYLVYNNSYYLNLKKEHPIQFLFPEIIYDKLNKYSELVEAKLKLLPDIELCEIDSGEFYINRNNYEINLVSRFPKPKLDEYKYLFERHWVNMINKSLVKTCAIPLEIQYDGKKWTEMPKIISSIRPMIGDCFEIYGQSKGSVKSGIYNKIIENIDKNEFLSSKKEDPKIFSFCDDLAGSLIHYFNFLKDKHNISQYDCGLYSFDELESDSKLNFEKKIQYDKYDGCSESPLLFKKRTKIKTSVISKKEMPLKISKEKQSEKQKRTKLKKKKTEDKDFDGLSGLKGVFNRKDGGGLFF